MRIARFSLSACLIVLGLSLAGSSSARGADEAVFEDGFDALPLEFFSPGVVGAFAEYHYISELAPQGGWVVSCFRSDGSQRAWRVIGEKGRHVMRQCYTSDAKEIAYTHPMIVGGDELWGDYTMLVELAPDSDKAQSGVVFRYRNDRCYYFVGVINGKAILKSVHDAQSVRTADEKILAEKPFAPAAGQYIPIEITVKGSHIKAVVNKECVLEADDTQFPKGRIGLMSDIPTRYRSVRVTMTPEAKKSFEAERKAFDNKELELQAANPKPVPWKKIETPGFGVGRNVRFGDLDGDGKLDVLLGQQYRFGPKDRNSELGCLTAMTFDGKRLWQVGNEDPWNNMLTNDVAFQIHDIDHDGKNEVIYTKNFELIVADGASGKTRYKIQTPENKSKKAPYDKFPRVLGDSLYILDLRGKGFPQDMILKDRYEQLWAFDDKLNLLWSATCNTGHYPFAYDVDGDGKDELAIGYSLFDDDGKLLWSHDKDLDDHADGVAVVRLQPGKDAPLTIINSASDEGMIYMDAKGKILKHLQLGHVQNPAVANFRSDLPGLETVSINFWGNQGIIHFYDANGDVYHDFEPIQYGSMMLPVNWTGRDEEYVMLSGNVAEGGMFDGWGRRVVRMPADGHPDLCSAVLDITGDCRDELVVWDDCEMWVYTQEDNPKQGKLYKPKRNPLYNSSNYQATLSLPGWSE